MRKTVVTAFILIFVLTISVIGAEFITFYDLGNHGWATSAICRLAEKGVIKGTAPHYYSPDNYTSKADFATLLGRLFEIGGNGLSAYPDVPADSYYTQSVAALKALGIIQPDSTGNFNPTDAISRTEAMRWTGFLLERFGFAPNIDTSVLERFGDSHLVPKENVKYTAILVEQGFITGDSAGNLNPGGYLTRAETAVILDRIYTAILE